MSTEYHKIQSIFKRDTKGKFIWGQYSTAEIAFLKDNIWEFTEKVDGTNIRVEWDLTKVTFKGKTEGAQIPAKLVAKLMELFPVEKFTKIYPDTPMTLYGEGYGANIQAGGGKYRPDGSCSFVLFDVFIDKWWLSRPNVEDIATKLGIEVVPSVGKGTLAVAIELTRVGVPSHWGDFIAEGLVMRLPVDLFDRNGKRIITKIKHKDFTYEEVPKA